MYKKIISLLIVFFLFLFSSCGFDEGNAISDKSGGLYDVQFQTNGVVVSVNDDVIIQLDDKEGNSLAGQEVKITFSKSFLNAGIFRKKLSLGQKVSIRYFLSGVNEEEKIITVERMSILE